jgi:hypothetical protein
LCFLSRFGGRPHWGKNFDRTFTHPKCPIRPKYKNFGKAMEVAKKYDPEGMYQPALFKKVRGKLKHTAGGPGKVGGLWEAEGSGEVGGLWEAEGSGEVGGLWEAEGSGEVGGSGEIEQPGEAEGLWAII